MPARDKLAAFRADPEANLKRLIERVPDGPSLTSAYRVSKVLGKLDMTNTSRPAARRGFCVHRRRGDGV